MGYASSIFKKSASSGKDKRWVSGKGEKLRHNLSVDEEP
jgi:hypothetical protein